MVQLDTNRHCVHVSQIIDWVYKPVQFQIKKSLENIVTCTERICGNIHISCGEKLLLWKGSENLSFSGTVTIFHIAGCDQMELIINGTTTYFLSESERTIVVKDLKSIEVRCIGNESSDCLGRYWITLQYHFYQYFDPHEAKLSCYLSDEEGNATNTIKCKKMAQKRNRKVQIVMPNGETIILHEKKIAFKGYITVKLIDGEKKFILCVIPFQFRETFYLSIQPRSELECNATLLACTPFFSKEGKYIQLPLQLCLEILVTSNTTIEVEGNYCLPRFDLFH